MEERIRYIRSDSGLSMAKFAEKIGVKAASISRLESGVNSPADRTVKLICSEFGVSETWLRTGEGDMYEKKPDNLIDRLASEYHMSITAVSFLETYLQLPREMQAALDQLLDQAMDRRADRLRAAAHADFVTASTDRPSDQNSTDADEA